MYVQREGQQDISTYMVETPGKLIDTTLHDVRYVIQAYDSRGSNVRVSYIRSYELIFTISLHINTYIMCCITHIRVDRYVIYIITHQV
jgi:hypothetical protein